MPLDPHAKRLLDMLSVAATGPATIEPQTMRDNFRRLTQIVGVRDVPVACITDAELPGPAGPLRYRLYRGADARKVSAPGLVFFHGGGGVYGDLDTHDAVCRQLANASHCAVVSVDYRLAPEHRFPAALDDALAAVDWIAGNAELLGIRRDRLAVGGDSAGAALAVAVCQEAKRSGAPVIALQVLFCPVMDLGGDTASRREFASGFFIDRATIAWIARHYCAPADLADPRVAPLRAVDFSHLPPAQIHTAEFDPLRDEGKAYADGLQAAGVPVLYNCHAGMIHHFYGMGGVIPYARGAIEQAGAAIAMALA